MKPRSWRVVPPKITWIHACRLSFSAGTARLDAFARQSYAKTEVWGAAQSRVAGQRLRVSRGGAGRPDEPDPGNAGEGISPSFKSFSWINQIESALLS